MAVEVCLSFNFAVVFDFILFPVPPSKANFLGIDLVNRRKAAIRSMFFYITLLMRILPFFSRRTRANNSLCFAFHGDIA